MRARGFAAIGLWSPKDRANVGGVLRAIGCYGGDMLAIAGLRYSGAPTDTRRQHRHTPVLHVDDIRAALPLGAVPIAVEISAKARSLTSYVHPESAFYVFGPEDGSLPDDVQRWCRDIVYVPTDGCMNLAATVNVVLYDRMLKR